MINLKKDCKNIVLLLIFVFVLGISVNVSAETKECGYLIDTGFIDAMNNYVYTPIKIATPVILLVLTSFDFAKIVFAGKKEDMDKAKNNFLKRFIAGVIIFFAPEIINLVVSLINDQSMSSCMNKFK